MAQGSFVLILKDLIESRGITQKQLAIDCGATEATISRYLSDVHKPTLDIAAKIAQALDVSVDYLCGLTDLSMPKESLGQELSMLLNCYKRSSSRDKKLIWNILEEYASPEEIEARSSTGIQKSPEKAR